jgi:diguanylate cyclase (GGDEF)-like protein
VPDWEDTTDATTVGETGDDEAGFERDRPCLVVLSGLHLGQTFPLDSGRPQTIGRSRSADIRLVDEGVSRKHIRIFIEGDKSSEQSSDQSLWLEDLESRNGTFCNGNRVTRRALHDGDKIQLGRNTMLRFTYLDAHDESFQRLMYDSALRDGLTRAFNRRYFSDRLRAEFRFAERHRSRLGLLMMDLDHFKAVNDGFGHVVGDFVLTEFADTIQQGIRNEDVFARYGGEEFALITRGIGAEHTLQLAERLRRAIEELPLEYEGKPIALTVSIGVACFPDSEFDSPDALVIAADRALYSAKDHGRNRVVLYQPGMESGSDDGDEWNSTDTTTIPV